VARSAAIDIAAVVGAREIGPVHRVAQHRRGDRGELRVLAVVQMVGLGRGEQDLLDPAAEEQRREPGVAPGPEGREDLRHRAAQVFEGGGPALIASSASTSTTCRSIRAKWSRKKGRTTWAL
jgi:hypothetical protein